MVSFSVPFLTTFFSTVDQSKLEQKFGPSLADILM